MLFYVAKVRVKIRNAKWISLTFIGFSLFSFVVINLFHNFEDFSIIYRPLPVADGMKGVENRNNIAYKTYDTEGRPASKEQKGIVINKGNKYMNR